MHNATTSYITAPKLILNQIYTPANEEKNDMLHVSENGDTQKTSS